MKKDFSDLKRPEPKPIEITDQKSDRQVFIKRNMAKSIDRSTMVIQAIVDWLLSFPTGITTTAFKAQIQRLDSEDSKAIQQLSLSKGKRTLSNPPREKPPKLDKELIEALEELNLIAIEAASGRKLIEEFMKDCPQIGIYVLDVNELVLEYVDYTHRGKAGEIIHEANRAEILIVLGLEKPISLAYHIRDTLFQIASVRAKNKAKYTISTWNYTHGWYIPDYEKLFKIYSI